MENGQIIEQTLLDELPAFENFLNRIGFKRIEGSVYGLLVLSPSPLTSVEIENTLQLSQPAVSNALKVLTHYGAVVSRDSKREDLDRRIKVHTVKEDSLSIVASVFRKREQETIQDFKQMAIRLEKISRDLSTENDPRNKRLKSIVSTCEIAESVISFVVELTKSKLPEEYPQVINQLPRTLQLLTSGVVPMANLTDQVKKSLTSKLKGGLERLSGEVTK
ncbi:GbsR/MarR family transcriptional regulator [Halobacteriovorax sp.]|uniref:GbsR/MarR family transcriptional regulator n=1 Tax=Halobacteriovorax sp. TaxID=2020862 RepID=UPI003565B87B